MIKRLLSLCVICVFATGCATKSLKVTTPAVKPPATVIGYVKIENVKDFRAFSVAPKDPALPSIEGDQINDKKLTDKSIGRMRHGMFHNALWNYSLKDKETIYSVSERIVSNSFTAAGYQVVSKGDAQYDSAVPVSVDVIQFWAWMQPKFNIDLQFDGELAVKSKDNSIAVTAKGTHMFSTAFAGGGNWTEVVNKGVEKLQANLTNELKQVKEKAPKDKPTDKQPMEKEPKKKP